MAKISLRVPDHDLAEIDRRAHQAGMSRTALILKASLGRATGDEHRLDDIEARLARVEEGLFS